MMCVSLDNFKCIVIASICILLCFSCGENTVTPQTNIPLVTVEERIALNSFENKPLVVPFGFVYLNAGYRGIIIHNLGGNQYVAYERACPYDVDKPCARVEVESGGLFMIDRCCLTTYSLRDGSVIGGPGRAELLRYSVSLDPLRNELFITN